ncbi:hypothetical protein RIF29_41288 [Crotalaria pallida]|uniref:Coenzyme Q-binding protein COQ10 START domain-containing protein n=1 Tax=Crotalaria pallida TaxID=3830 RepID=A0AAN9HP80_CROPI
MLYSKCYGTLQLKLIVYHRSFAAGAFLELTLILASSIISGPLPTSSSEVNNNWGVFGKVCRLDRPCVVDEVHLRRFDGLLENGGVHRCVVASITVKAPVCEVWNAMSSYETLPEIVPNLAISKILSRDNNKVRILQEGYKGLLYMVLHARVVLDLCEYLEQEISFEQVEVDFDSFQGKWIFEQLGNRHTLLKYSVDSKVCEIGGKICAKSKGASDIVQFLFLLFGDKLIINYLLRLIYDSWLGFQYLFVCMVDVGWKHRAVRWWSASKFSLFLLKKSMKLQGKSVLRFLKQGKMGVEVQTRWRMVVRMRIKMMHSLIEFMSVTSNSLSITANIGGMKTNFTFLQMIAFQDG